MSFSDSTVNAMAKAIAPEIIQSIATDGRFTDFMFDVLHDIVGEKLGNVDEDLLVDLTGAIFERISLKDAEQEPFNFKAAESKIWEERYNSLLSYVKSTFKEDYVDGAEYAVAVNLSTNYG